MELYEIWRRELDNVELERLPPDFYPRIADYINRLKEERRMLDKKTVKARLLESEMRNVKRMLNELIQVRYKKLIKIIAKGQKAQSGSLTVEEAKIYEVLPIAETYQRFVKSVLQGHVPKEVNIEQGRKRVVLRFLSEVPAIIGADMETYGPFKVEDLASLPVENATILVKQGLAERVEI
jgi:DNA replication factor GINS